MVADWRSSSQLLARYSAGRGSGNGAADTNNKHLGDIGDKVGIHHQYNARVKGNFVLLLASIKEIAQADLTEQHAPE